MYLYIIYCNNILSHVILYISCEKHIIPKTKSNYTHTHTLIKQLLRDDIPQQQVIACIIQNIKLFLAVAWAWTVCLVDGDTVSGGRAVGTRAVGGGRQQHVHVGRLEDVDALRCGRQNQRRHLCSSSKKKRVCGDHRKGR